MQANPSREQMANGNVKVIRAVLEEISSGKSLDIDTRDKLLFTAVIDIYEHLEKLQPALLFYKVGMFFAGAIGLAILGFIGGLLTGQIEVIIR